jgi:hypothetical protein
MHVRNQQARLVIVNARIEVQVLLIILERRNILQITLMLERIAAPPFTRQKVAFNSPPNASKSGAPSKPSGNGHRTRRITARTSY